MKCPYCEYVDGFTWVSQGNYAEKPVTVTGEEGKFWKLPYDAQRQTGDLSLEKRGVYACPNCCKLFLLGAGV